MTIGETSYDRINDYASVKISLARPHDIRSWSFGEVKKPETINYRTYRPEKDGLFCERIFGPEKDWECACGKYRCMKYKGMICDRCGVKVTHSRVRRKRMGHIELAAPVVHIWFFKAMPSRLGTLLDMKTTSLEKIIYFQDYVVIDPGTTPLKERQLLTEDEYKTARTEYGDAFEVDMGAEAVKKLLDKLNLVDLSRDLRERLDKETARGPKASKQRTKELVIRRGEEAGDDQLSDLPAGEGWPLLRADLRAGEGLGVRLRQVPRDEVQGDDLRPLWREGHAQPRAPQAHGSHRAGCAGCPHLVLQVDAEPPGRAPQHEDLQPREGDLLPGLRGHRPG
jgi:hypothetical protein